MKALHECTSQLSKPYSTLGVRDRATYLGFEVGGKIYRLRQEETRGSVPDVSKVVFLGQYSPNTTGNQVNLEAYWTPHDFRIPDKIESSSDAMYAWGKNGRSNRDAGGETSQEKPPRTRWQRDIGQRGLVDSNKIPVTRPGDVHGFKVTEYKDPYKCGRCGKKIQERIGLCKTCEKLQTR